MRKTNFEALLIKGPCVSSYYLHIKDPDIQQTWVMVMSISETLLPSGTPFCPKPAKAAAATYTQ